MKYSFLYCLLAFVISNLFNVSFAKVNPDNGNFDVKYTDFIVFNNGINIEFSRTYNSRSSYIRGYFGVGWSSDMEGYLQIEKNNISYFEGGGGNLIRFEPVPNKAKTWSSEVLGKQYLNLTPAGYVLENSNGRKFLFDLQGRMKKISDNNKNYIEFVYEKATYPVMIKDNFNNQVRLTWKVFGAFPRITLIERNENKARYEYNALGDLVRAEGVDGVPYVYSYDDEHNLIKITYQSGAYKELSYNKIRDWVVHFRDMDGMVTDYEYFSDSIDPENKFGTIVTQFKEGSSKKEQARFWYEFRRRPNNTSYKYRSVTVMRVIDNNDLESINEFIQTGFIPQKVPYTFTESFYTQCCGTPLSISLWNESSNYSFPTQASNVSWTQTAKKKNVTQFEYYTEGEIAGFLKKKVLASGEVLAISYDSLLKKVSELKRGNKLIKYQYDKDGNPLNISDFGSNNKFSIQYGLKGEIDSVKIVPMNGNSLRIVFFRYNADGLPIEIKEKFGKQEERLQVTYLPNGQINQMLNSKGRTIASRTEKEAAKRISETFIMLMGLIKPSGLTLGPEG
jgi:YD repeat-containing protein